MQIGRKFTTTTGQNLQQNSGINLCVNSIFGFQVFFSHSSSSKYLGNICRGFFLHDGHLGGQFQYMTNTPPLNQNIEENLRIQLGTNLNF